MPTYNSALFDPPAPLARVTLRNPNDRRSVTDVPMLLDSGADVTLIPQVYAEQLRINADQYCELAGFDGSIRIAPSARLEMLFLGRTFHGRFMIVDQEFGVIGRNVLNNISLLLNGPQLVWNEHPDDEN